MVERVRCNGRDWREVAGEWNIDPYEYRPILFSNETRHLPFQELDHFLRQLKQYPNCDERAFLFTEALDDDGRYVESLVVPDPQTPQLRRNSAEVNGDIGKTYVVAKAPQETPYIGGRVYPFVLNDIFGEEGLSEIIRYCVYQITRIDPQRLELEIEVVTREKLIDCCLELMDREISLSRKLLGELGLECSSSRIYTEKVS